MASEPPSGGLDDDVKAETVRVFYRRTDAELAAANLQAHGVHCWISADDAGGMYPNLSGPEGVSLLVLSSDAPAARALLDVPEPPPEIPDQSLIEASTTAVRWGWRPAPGQIILGLIAGVLLCLFWQWRRHLGTKTYYVYNANGVADEAWVYHNGILEQLMRDRNHDGRWDDWVYYENGQAKRVEEDNNFDGKPDETWIYSNGIVAELDKDTDFNGTPDEYVTYENGVPRQIDIRPNGARFPTQRQLYQNGVLVEILQKPDGNGLFTESVKYDPFFNPISTNRMQ